MKSLSKIYAPSLDAQLDAWNISDLDIEENVFPADKQAEQILDLFGAGQRNSSIKSNRGSGLFFHSDESIAPLTNWSPGDLVQQPVGDEIQKWEFANEQTSDFYKIPEQQILKEKFEAEKERVELIKQAREQAEVILSEARKKANELVLNAQNQVDQAKRNAYANVYNELQVSLAATQAMIEEARQWKSSLMQSGEQILLGMLKEIAQTMFGEGVQLDANALQINLNRVMESAQRIGDLNIFLNPRDAGILDPSWSSYQLLITGNKVRIVPSEKILPGGCFIKGSTGTVDARVETQMASVMNLFEEVSGISG